MRTSGLRRSSSSGKGSIRLVDSHVPRHVAIIMDGNGRWARSQGKPRIEGHRQGVEALRRSVRFAGERGIEILTLFSFSSENWCRSAREIEGLFNLVREYIRIDLAKLKRRQVRIRVIGTRDRLPDDLVHLIDLAERETLENAGMQLVIAFNYGARDEILRATRKLAEQVASRKLRSDAIDQEVFEGALDTVGLPDPDLLIRTSGEERISNFLLWQVAFAELVFLSVRWPDFRAQHFEEALGEYMRRHIERRAVTEFPAMEVAKLS